MAEHCSSKLQSQSAGCFGRTVTARRKSQRLFALRFRHCVEVVSRKGRHTIFRIGDTWRSEWRSLHTLSRGSNGSRPLAALDATALRQCLAAESFFVIGPHELELPGFTKSSKAELFSLPRPRDTASLTSIFFADSIVRGHFGYAARTGRWARSRPLLCFCRSKRTDRSHVAPSKVSAIPLRLSASFLCTN